MKIILFLLLLTSCQTPYQPSSFGGGYTDREVSPSVYQISFRGNGFTSKESVKNNALLRANELCTSKGYKSFDLLDNKDEEKIFKLNDTMNCNTNFNSFSNSAQSNCSISQGGAFHKHENNILVRCKGIAGNNSKAINELIDLCFDKNNLSTCESLHSHYMEKGDYDNLELTTSKVEDIDSKIYNSLLEKDGIYYYEKKEFKRSVLALEGACDNMSVTGCLYLGLSKDEIKDNAGAKKAFKRSCLMNDGLSCYNLYLMTESKADKKRAMGLLEKECNSVSKKNCKVYMELVEE